MKPKTFWDNFKPDFFADSVYDIDNSWLAARKIGAVIVDVDNTIMARGARAPDNELRDWVAGIKDSGIKLLAVSNNWTDRVKQIAVHLDVPLLAPAAKPLGPAFKNAIAKMSVEAQETVIIGDQLFTDILGGNRAGLWTVLVAPISDVDLIHTKILRIFERVLLKKLSGRSLVNGSWQEI